MGSLGLHVEVLLTAFVGYALIILSLTLWNAHQARQDLGRRDEARPGAHVADEGGAEALVGQILRRDR